MCLITENLDLAAALDKARAELADAHAEIRFQRDLRDKAINAADRLHQQLLALAAAVAPVLADDAACEMLAETRRMFGATR